jgi:hypothetical protein
MLLVKLLLCLFRDFYLFCQLPYVVNKDGYIYKVHFNLVFCNAHGLACAFDQRKWNTVGYFN